MKYSLLFFILLSLQSKANTFDFRDRPYSFRLSITKDSLTFSSEQFRHSRKRTPCNQALISELNHELLKLSSHQKGTGVTVLIDGQKSTVGQRSKERIALRDMDLRMRVFALEEGRLCGI